MRVLRPANATAAGVPPSAMTLGHRAIAVAQPIWDTRQQTPSAVSRAEDTATTALSHA